MKTAPPRSRATSESRLIRLETGIESISKGLADFVSESRDFRRNQESEQDKIWGAINHQNASRAITWPMIFTAITVLLAVVGAAAKVSYAFTELRILVVEERVGRAMDGIDRQKLARP